MDKNDNIVMISKDIRANERYIRERLADCGDIQIRKMRLGDERKVDCLMVYIEVATSNMMLEDSAIGKMVGHFWEISPGEMQEFVEYNSLGIADVKKLTDMEQVFAGLLAGNAVFFMDGFDQAMKISSAGYPSMGVTEVEMEKVLRGYQIKGSGILYWGEITYTGPDGVYGRSGAGGISGAGERAAWRVSNRWNPGQWNAGTADGGFLVIPFSAVSDYGKTRSCSAGNFKWKSSASL